MTLPTVPPPVPRHAESLFTVDPTKIGIPAATLVVFGPPDERDEAELLFVERSAAMSFAPGAVVFPGGRVDPADRELARACAPQLDSDDGAARVAAIRETVEETGLLIGLKGQPDRIAEDLRGDMAAGGSLAAWLDRAGYRLDLDRLVAFARWDPRFRNHRSFDTRFYIAALAGEGGDIAPDGIENTATFWASARRVLADVRAERRSAIFPTERNLERLELLPDFTRARNDAKIHAGTTITPALVEEGDQAWLSIPEAAGYPVTRVAVGEVSRGTG